MILCEEHTPHYWYDDSEFEYCPKCQINDLWSKVDELEGRLEAVRNVPQVVRLIDVEQSDKMMFARNVLAAAGGQ